MGGAFLAERVAPLRFESLARASPPQARQVARQGKFEVMDWYAVNGGDWERFPSAQPMSWHRGAWQRKRRRNNLAGVTDENGDGA
jgi:hypothetical protein